MSTNSSVPLSDALPPSLNLPPHLSAQKYFFVCTLTVAAWDTLVLSPRAYRLFKTEGRPPLKNLFDFLRVFMPVEFIIVGVAFFDTKWTQGQCQHFFLFEPICTAILLAATSAVHVIRIHAIYEQSRTVLTGMGVLYALQIVVTAICCGFYRSVPLDVGQGCIAGPKYNWVGIYWLAPTLLYTVSLALALNISFKSRAVKPIGLWKLMLRDGLNLYGAIWLVNMANMLFWFIMPATGIDDPVKTIVTSMAAVLTTSMTLRIILSVRGSLAHGGSFAGHHSSSSGTHSHSLGASHSHSHSHSHSGQLHSGARAARPTFTLDEQIRGAGAETKEGAVVGEEWDGKDSVLNGSEGKGAGILPIPEGGREGGVGVTITIDREVEYDNAPAYAGTGTRGRGRK